MSPRLSWGSTPTTARPPQRPGHRGRWEGSGAADEKAAAAQPLPGSRLTRAPEAGPDAGAVADVVRAPEVPVENGDERITAVTASPRGPELVSVFYLCERWTGTGAPSGVAAGGRAFSVGGLGIPRCI